MEAAAAGRYRRHYGYTMMRRFCALSDTAAGDNDTIGNKQYIYIYVYM